MIDTLYIYITPVAAPVLLLRGTRWEASASFEPPIFINENLSHDVHEHEERTGLRIWDSSIALAKYIEKLEKETIGTFHDKKVIELGSGCGLVGIAAGRLGAQVILTDVGGLVSQLTENIHANHLEQTVIAKELFWGTDVSAFSPPFDFILASDVTWVTHLVEPLVQTISALSSEKTQTLLAMEHRSKITEDLFFELLYKYKLTYKTIPHTEHDRHYSDKLIDIYFITKL